MRSFFWRTVFCVLPCLWAGWITGTAVSRYIDGEPGGIKMGVDLEGGTILVYEIDLTKQSAAAKGDTSKTNLLAEALKRRIDPNDLKNIVIRPAGEGRVEIVLPTGGLWRTQKADAAWKKLKEEIADDPDIKVDPDSLTVDRGNPDELADKIQLILSERTWKKTFSDPKVWENLLQHAYGAKIEDKDKPVAEADKGEWRNLPRVKEMHVTTKQGQVYFGLIVDKNDDQVVLKLPGGEQKTIPFKDVEKSVTEYRCPFLDATTLPADKRIPPGDTTKLVEVLQAELAKIQTNPPTENDLKNWIKREAWRAMLDKVLDHWKTDLESSKVDLYAIRPDSQEQLIGFVNAKGNVVGQAFISAMAPIVGVDELGAGYPDRKEVKKFILDNYGPSLTEIRKKIRDKLEDTGRSQDLTVEEVQRIKDLVSKVGSLEFLMLANSVDDKKAEDRMMAQIKSEENKSDLVERQNNGLPPFGPFLPGSKTPEAFTILLPHGQKSVVTYRWVELGPQERKQLNLDNAAEFDRTDRNHTWTEAKLYRDRGEAAPLHDLSQKQKLLLQGALFFSRECTNRNLPEEERRAKKIEYFVLARNPEIDPATDRQTPDITGALLRHAQVGTGSDLRPAVHFEFLPEGGRLFGDLTRKNVPSDTGGKDDQVKRHLAIVLDGLVMSAPSIMSQISTNGQISGSFTQKEVSALVNILNSGSLPATLKPQPVSESMLGPTLGLDTIRSGVTAVMLAFGAVLVFMVLYYRFAGLVASVALLANLVLTVGFMIGVQATFTLPGLAGLVLMVGMAVDANVLIYERLREERERGASLALSIRNGYDRALPIIIDTHLTGIFTAIVLYVVGNDQLRGFGVSLTVGLIISLFTSLYMTRLLFDFWLHKGWLHKLSMFKMFSKPNIDFMGIRNYMFVATITLAVLGVALFIGRGQQGLNIDFIGGTAYGGKLTEPVSMGDLRKMVDDARQKEMLSGVEVKEVPGTNGYNYEIRYPGEDVWRAIALARAPERRAEAVKELAERLPDPSVEQIFPSFDVENAKKSPLSKYFIIRTSEKEPELVQAMLDRLLSVKKDGKLTRLMDFTYVKMDQVDKNSPLNQRFDFYKKAAGLKLTDAQNTEDLKKGPEGLHTLASPSFFKTLIARHLKLQFGSEKPPEFDVVGGEGWSSEGRYARMNFVLKGEDAKTLSQNPALAKKVLDAVTRAKDEFELRPQPDMLETFDSQLATETQYRAMAAIILSWGAILVYLWFRFGSWTFGLAAVICLIHDLFFTLGAIAACHFIDNTFIGYGLMLQDFKIDLPAVAALLTLIGYSVNDTIVVFDRIREIRGKHPELTAKMINDSVNQTLSRTLLTSLTTWLVVIVLYIFGGPGVHLFAFVMVVGVIVGTYSSIYIASPLLLMFGEGVPVTTTHGGRPSESVMAAK